MIRLEIKNYNTVLTEKQQRYQDYHPCKKILPFDQSWMIEQAKFIYSSLKRAFAKQIKTSENQRKKQVKTIGKHGKQIIKSYAIIENYYYDTEKDRNFKTKRNIY